MHERAAGVRGARASLLERLLHGGARELDARPEPLDGRDLGDGRVARHEHLALHAAHERGLCHRSPVVAGARRDEAGAGLLAQRRELGERAAQLERSGALQALGLERHTHPGGGGELLASDRGGAHRDALDRGARGFEVDRRDQLRCVGRSRIAHGRGAAGSSRVICG